MALKLLQSFVSSVTTLWCLSMLLLLYQASHKTAFASTRLGRNETDRLALLSIKAQITQDPMLITSSWNDSRHFCQWKGVLCSQRHLRVTRLNLESYNLAGNLSHCHNLRILVLDQNKFIGNLPTELGSLSQLVALTIQSNNLTRTIPASFGNLSSLQLFMAGENMLEGNIPGSLGSLKSLRILFISVNKLSGIIPPSIYNLSSLAFFWAPYNQFQGSLPRNLGLTLPNIRELNFVENQLSGLIPRSISNASKLELLILANNKFSPGVPINFGNLKNLSRLFLQGSGLGTGNINDLKFISTLVNCSKLTGLYIAINNFGGVLPNSIANLSTQLQHLIVAGNKISGSIPADIGNLVSLNTLGVIPQSLESLRGIEELDLSDNSLSGQIPKFLGSLPFLRKLDLSFNDLEGEIPVGEVFQNASAISVSGNNKLCGGIPALGLPSCPDVIPRKKKMPLGLALLIPIVCGVFSIILTSSILILCWLRKMRRQPSMASSLMDLWGSISYNKLLKATNGFSSANLIGPGSFGSVHKGILNPSDQKAIAVKVFNQQRRGATKSFMAECKALKNIRHRNLVKIISACASVDFQANDFKALVYEYMENGSLEYWLHPVLSQTGHAQEQQKSLSLLQRLGIAIDVASALDYLHNHCHILIQGSYDISELVESQISSVGTKGTIGYVAPEYGMGHEISTNNDVYNYGILLLELFTGKRPTDGMFIDGLDLHKLAKLALPERVMEIVDQNLLDKEEGASKNSSKQMKSEKIIKCLSLIFRIGVACSEQLPRE
ncbi:leucine-rich repeat protein kinase family protein [Actinidia rufa]|uniref:Leucine-rich repeat protein kinase family protein n=1 Tax=Actinidia rufa TaxID=165716 RepID=A0A7J0F4L6_9ERIC|nr:leucine-rich repeat protein kinase family protein [Actinidia rufa]